MREISLVVSIFGVFLFVFFVEKYDAKITYAENDAIVITASLHDDIKSENHTVRDKRQLDDAVAFPYPITSTPACLSSRGVYGACVPSFQCPSSPMPLVDAFLSKLQRSSCTFVSNAGSQESGVCCDTLQAEPYQYPPLLPPMYPPYDEFSPAPAWPPMSDWPPMGDWPSQYPPQYPPAYPQPPYPPQYPPAYPQPPPYPPQYPPAYPQPPPYPPQYPPDYYPPSEYPPPYPPTDNEPSYPPEDESTESPTEPAYPADETTKPSTEYWPPTIVTQPTIPPKPDHPPPPTPVYPAGGGGGGKPTTKPPYKPTTKPPYKPTTKPPYKPTTQRPPWQRPPSMPTRPTVPATLPPQIPTSPPDTDDMPDMNECGIKNGQQDQDLRIVGGHDADPGEWPWMAAIFTNGRLFCGGSLIDRVHILTAAHCVAHMHSWDVAGLRVHLADYNIKSKGDGQHIERRVKKVVRHRGFDPQTLYNDIAVLTLDKPVTFSQKVRPVCLPHGKSAYSGRMATVIGWGSVREMGPMPDILQEVNIPVWTNRDCKRKYGQAAPGGIIESFLCAGKASKDSCSGDSGGPLMINDGKWQQVGIVSWGIGCGKGQFPGVYTRLTSFMPWLSRNLNL